MDNFEKHWKEFIKGNMSKRTPEELDRYELAKMFYELGSLSGVTNG